MKPARRHRRANPKRPTPAALAGIAACQAALYSTEPITPERAAELMRELERTPHLPQRQGELKF